MAYDFYVRAVSIIYNAQIGSLDPVADGLVNLSEAVELLNKAVARDPNFFLAYCQLAFAHDLIRRTPPHFGPGKVGHRFCISVEAGFGGSAPGAGVAPLLALRIMTAPAPNLLLLNRVYPITRKFTS